MLYKYVIWEEYEIDWGIYGGGEAELFTEEKISEEEWKEIVTNAFHAVYKEDPCLMDVDDIAKHILEHDKRFKTVDAFIENVGRSEFMNSMYYSEEELKGTEDWIQTEPDDDGDNYLLNP